MHQSVAGYTHYLEQEDEDVYKEQFPQYLANSVTPDVMREMYDNSCYCMRESSL